MDKHGGGLAETASRKGLRRVALWFEAIALIRDGWAYRPKHPGQTAIEEEMEFHLAVVKRFELMQDD